MGLLEEFLGSGSQVTAIRIRVELRLKFTYWESVDVLEACEAKSIGVEEAAQRLD